MTKTTELPAITRTVRVKATPARAFEVFTTNIIRWWPAAYSIGQSPMREIALEPHVGGRWYEIGEDQSQCQWGDVLSWNPPKGLTLAWRINMQWTFDPALLTEVWVSFDDIGNGETEVRIVHSQFENYGADAEAAMQVFDGWSSILGRFADVVIGRTPDDA